jgi:hypothetical protein
MLLIRKLSSTTRVWNRNRGGLQKSVSLQLTTSIARHARALTPSCNPGMQLADLFGCKTSGCMIVARLHGPATSHVQNVRSTQLTRSPHLRRPKAGSRGDAGTHRAGKRAKVWSWDRPRSSRDGSSSESRFPSLLVASSVMIVSSSLESTNGGVTESLSLEESATRRSGSMVRGEASRAGGRSDQSRIASNRVSTSWISTRRRWRFAWLSSRLSAAVRISTPSLSAVKNVIRPVPTAVCSSQNRFIKPCSGQGCEPIAMTLLGPRRRLV